MFCALRLAVMSITAFTFLASASLGGQLGPCRAACLITSWKHDGFWRSSAVIDPPYSIDGNDIRYVGKIRAGRRTYKIYYDEQTNAVSEAHDATHDLDITTAAGKFLGLYEISDVLAYYEEPVSIEGSDIVFPSSKAGKKPYRYRLHFGPEGPPKKLLNLFGSDVAFDTPADVEKNTAPSAKGIPEPRVKISAYCRRR